jgi:hypothetical protein
MALSVDTNFNIFDDISATPKFMRHWRYNAHAGVLQPRIAPFKLATRFSVSVFSGDLSSAKPACPSPLQHPTPAQPRILIFQTMLASP